MVVRREGFKAMKGAVLVVQNGKHGASSIGVRRHCMSRTDQACHASRHSYGDKPSRCEVPRDGDGESEEQRYQRRGDEEVALEQGLTRGTQSEEGETHERSDRGGDGDRSGQLPPLTKEPATGYREDKRAGSPR